MELKFAALVPVLFLVACSGGDKIAKVGDESITQQQFDAHIQFKRVNPAKAEQVDAELARYLEQTALATAIDEADLYSQELLQAEFDEFKKQMLISRYMSAYLDEAVSDTAIENYYNAHQDDYSRKQAKVSHIVFRVHKAMSEPEKQAAQQSAREMLAKLAKGEAFEALAASFSEDIYSSEKGGDLGWVEVGSIDPAFSAALLQLEPESYSDVVKTQYGFHIIKLQEPFKIDVAPLAQVTGDIRYQLRQKAKVAETERLLKSVTIKQFN